jgi:urea transport system ATP-binding protein
MVMLRIAATMAWADDNFAPVQQQVILDRLSQQFSQDPTEQAHSRKSSNYLAKAYSP